MAAFGRQLSECGIQILDSVDSTNSEAMRQAARGQRGPKWIMARRQSSGRGRSGRAWQSEDGNLQASLLMESGCPLEGLAQLSLVAGVAAHDAILAAGGERAAGRGLRLKWPNDILIGGGKAGGILVESTQLGRDRVVVIGIGINVVTAPEVPGRRITSLASEGIACDAGGLLEALRAAMADWVQCWGDGSGMEEVRQAWLDRAGAEGEGLTVDTGRETVTGRFAGLDADGALLVECATGVRRFTFGETRLAAMGKADQEDD